MAPQQHSPREVVEFPPNVPVTLALKYGQPKMISNQYGERAMFTTVDNRVLFLDMPVAGQICELGINVRESFSITKRTSGKKDAPITWEVARLTPAVGEQPNGTYVVPKAPEPPASAPEAAPAPKPMARATASSNALIEECNLIVDAYAEVLDRGLKLYSGRVKPDEIQRLFTTVYIQRGKLSSVA